ncbi:MAG: hypothetical protein WDM79_15030 [Terricaulis sp.]
MADSDSGGSSATPWLAFLTGIVVVALLVVGFFAFTGTRPEQQTADLNLPTIEAPEINLPDNVQPPSVDLPDVTINPPAAEPAPAAPAPAQ